MMYQEFYLAHFVSILVHLGLETALTMNTNHSLLKIPVFLFVFHTKLKAIREQKPGLFTLIWRVICRVPD